MALSALTGASVTKLLHFLVLIARKRGVTVRIILCLPSGLKGKRVFS